MYAHRLAPEPGPVEARIRALVADHLGVSVEDVEPNVSLVDELAADSLDLVEIALAIEADLRIVLPRHFLDEVRTCGELVDATIARWKANRADDDRPVALRARLTPAGDACPWTVEWVVLLTPYAAESLADDALRAGSGARLELRVPPRTSEGVLARVRKQFSRLGERGIQVEVRRDAA